LVPPPPYRVFFSGKCCMLLNDMMNDMMNDMINDMMNDMMNDTLRDPLLASARELGDPNL
jgi:hypothetical protein